MDLRLNLYLTDCGLDLVATRLLRHQERRQLTPYALWQSDPNRFDEYQSTQSIKDRSKLSPAKNWVSFVGAPDGRTIFVGVYRATHMGPLRFDKPHPLGGTERAGECDEYELQPDEHFSGLVGRLIVDWGDGKRSWIQRAHLRDKPIVELRDARYEPPFPGFGKFRMPLSELASIPRSWAAVLGSVRGIYLLTCPHTKEQYVGKADGVGGLLGRWSAYLVNGHGGNVGLKSRDPSDYQVSILEIASLNTSDGDLDELERLWKLKLQSREMGLNRN